MNSPKTITPAHRRYQLSNFNTRAKLESHLREHYYDQFLVELSDNVNHRNTLIDDLCKNAIVLEHVKGAPLFFQGDISIEWFFVLDGSVSIHVYTTADSDAFKTSTKLKEDEKKKKWQLKNTNKADRNSVDDVRARHCQGEVLVLGSNGLFIEVLPDHARFPLYRAAAERKLLGVTVSNMNRGNSFGQVGLLNKSPRSG